MLPDRRRLRGAAVVLSACLSSVPGVAVADGLDERILSAFRDWSASHRFERAAIAVLRDGEVIATDSVGDTSPEKPEPVASVSKAITGMCVVKLVEDGALTYDETLGIVLRRYFARVGEPVDHRFRDITVAQLLEHTSGIGDGAIDRHEVALFDQVRDTIAIPLIHDPGDGFHYENKNFQVLGLIVEQVTGRRYQDACRDLVLTPAGVGGARIDGLQPYMASWAGWNISAVDAARFLRSFDPNFRVLRTGPADWPSTDLHANRTFYGPGVRVRHNEDGSFTVHHAGVWSWGGKPADRNFMARIVLFGSGVGFAVNASPSSKELGADLEHRIWLAMVAEGADVVRR